MRKLLFVLILVWGVISIDQSWGAYSFQGLGDSYGRLASARALGVSGDGGTVVGVADRASNVYTAMYWQAGTGIKTIGDLPGGDSQSKGYDANYDGTVIVGQGETEAGSRAMYWTADERMQELLVPSYDIVNSSAQGVSRDGQRIVGFATTAVEFDQIGVIWDNKGEVITYIDDLPGGENYCSLRAVSADGRIVAGCSSSFRGREAFIWTEEGGMERLGVTMGLYHYNVTKISADGTTVIGNAKGGEGEVPYRWTREEGIVELDRIGDGFNIAMDVSGNGSVVVGMSGEEAFIWDRNHGTRKIFDVLEENGIDLGEWELSNAYGISDDGTVIVGFGVNPAGDIEGWVAVIPEPCTLGLLVVGVGVLRRRRS